MEYFGHMTDQMGMENGTLTPTRFRRSQPQVRVSEDLEEKTVFLNKVNYPSSCRLEVGQLDVSETGHRTRLSLAQRPE